VLVLVLEDCAPAESSTTVPPALGDAAITRIRVLFPLTFPIIGTTRVSRRGVVVSGVRRMNEVNARRARLVPGWVTVFGRVYHLGM